MFIVFFFFLVMYIFFFFFFQAEDGIRDYKVTGVQTCALPICYALDIGLSYGLGHDPAGTSLIPVIGPLVQMGDSWAMVKPSQTGDPMVDGPANQRIDEVNNTIQQAAYAVLAVDFVL